jgi:hypothetical protein
MGSQTRKLGRWGFVVLVLGALGFGATQALASPPRQGGCQPCATQEECDKCCREVLGLDGGDCFPPVCLCL